MGPVNDLQDVTIKTEEETKVGQILFSLMSFIYKRESEEQKYRSLDRKSQ